MPHLEPHRQQEAKCDQQQRGEWQENGSQHFIIETAEIPLSRGPC